MKKINIFVFLFLLIFGFTFAKEEFGYPYYPVSDKQLSQFINKDYKKFRGINEEGKIVSIQDIVDGKPSVLIFFAIGDKPGTFDFLPHMNSLYEKYKGKVEFAAVLLSRSNKEEVKELKKMLPLKIPVLLGFNEAISQYKITKLDVPYLVFIDKNGKVKHIILRPESEMIKESPKVDHTDYKDKTQSERINASMKIIEKYIEEISGE
ncbi:MAG: TlpA family protein disulfide reductase [Aquificota bacterium]|nr:MAG: TlpA family protein disulfide reductase [Aquificota bacterium]